jgi:hypothetical protein
MTAPDARAQCRPAIDRLDAEVVPLEAWVNSEKALIVRMDGGYSIETVESAAIAANSDPDFVTAIPLTLLRTLINRSVN